MKSEKFNALLNELEASRKQVLEEASAIQKKGVIAGAVAVFFFLIMVIMESLEVGGGIKYVFLFIAIVAGIIAASIFAKSERKKRGLTKMIKERLISLLVEHEFEQGKFEPSKHIAISDINAAGLVKKPDRYNGEDYIQGYLDGVFFQTSDIELKEKKVRSNGKSTYVTYEKYFKGRWYIFDFNKDINGILKVLESSFSPFGGFTYGGKSYKTESMEFNKKFKIYASEQHMVFYLLTPSMIVKMLDLEKAHSGKIYFAFLKGKLHIAINDNKNYFNLKINNEISAEGIKYLMQDLEIIKDIILELKLNDNIFKQKQL